MSSESRVELRGLKQKGSGMLEKREKLSAFLYALAHLCQRGRASKTQSGVLSKEEIAH